MPLLGIQIREILQHIPNFLKEVDGVLFNVTVVGNGDGQAGGGLGDLEAGGENLDVCAGDTKRGESVKNTVETVARG